MMVEVPAVAVESLIRFTDDFLGAQVRDMIRLHGLEESGAGSYYVQRVRLRNGSLFAGLERELYHSLIALAKDYRVHVVHAGVGLGTFSILLSLSGMSVLGVEMGRDRAWGARQLRAAYVQLFPEHESQYEFREGEFPGILRPSDIRSEFKNVLLFTNVGNAWPESLEHDIMNSFKNFDFVYFCPSMFGSRGRTREGCDILRNMISQIAPGKMQKISDTLVYHDFCYVHEVLRPSEH